MRRIANLQGLTIGSLVVISYQGSNAYRSPMWLCRCACGRETVLQASHIKSGVVKTCGCNQGGVTHGHTRNHGASPTYQSWAMMIQRCTNPNLEAWPNYGGRGIKVCERWLHSFENFVADMGPRLSLKHSIDRFPNNDGNYEPSNCRWATRKEQNTNRRNRVICEGRHPA